MTATPTPGDLSARLQAWLLRHDLNDARSTETRALVSEAAAALSALPAGGDVPEDWVRFGFHGERVACRPAIAERVQNALLREVMTGIEQREATTPPPDAAVPSDDELPGMWSGADLIGGKSDAGWPRDGSALMDVALMLWHRFAAEHVERWEDEPEKAIYTLAADAIIRRLAAPAAGKGVDDASERDAFEKWARKRHGLDITKWADTGNYTSTWTRNWWECWQAALTRQPVAGDGWRPIESAPRDGTRVLLRLKHGLPAHVHGFEGVVFVGKWLGGHSHWAFAAPVGQAGFPDEWMDGWCRAAPADTPADGGEGK